MSEPEGACACCLRRSWLLGRLGAALDYRCTDIARLMDLLALDDDQLIKALAGARRETLSAEHRRFDAAGLRPAGGMRSICRHDSAYPPRLRTQAAPPMLHLLGGPQPLAELTRRPVVAVVGTHMASDYGIQVAGSLGRGLAASGVTVVSGLLGGISIAAHTGALEVGGAAFAVAGCGLDLAGAARRRPMVERLRTAGCVVSELPCGTPGRRWGAVACERITVGLAEVTVLVEAGESSRDLVAAGIAGSLGRALAAVPGRVFSRTSRGTNAMLADGAHLVRDAKDVLELLSHESRAVTVAGSSPLQLEPRLAEVLMRVGEGRDSLEKLTGSACDAGEVLLALSELELMRLLTRGAGGRYLPRL